MKNKSTWWIRKVAETQAAIAALTGVPVLWRGLSISDMEGQLEECQYHHCNPFCMAVKASTDRHVLCQGQESTDLVAEIQVRQGPYCKHCHAGVVELVVPILERGQYLGALLWGPFRESAGACPYSEANEEFLRLPLYQEARAAQSQVLLSLLAEFIVMVRRQTLRVEAIRDSRVAAALSWLEENHAQPFDLKAIARHCGLSPSRLVHLFRKECGISMTTYLAQIRVQEAKRFLVCTEKDLGDIALCVGLVDQSYFGAVFKRHTGLSPRKYRLQERQTP